MKTIYQTSLILVLAICMSVNLSIAQIPDIEMNYSSGSYEIDSDEQNSSLHFYLFGDGYYSFSPDVDHQFHTDAVPAEVSVHFAGPYDQQDPEKFALGNANNGVANPIIPLYSLDNSVNIQRSWNLVNDSENYFVLTFENSSSAIPIEGCLEFHYNSEELTINATEILDDYGNDWVDYIMEDDSDYASLGYDKKFIWHFEELEHDEQRMVYIPALCLSPVFANVNVMAIQKILDCESTFPYSEHMDGSQPGVSNSPYYTLSSTVANFPHDPNCIVADPDYLRLDYAFQTIRYRFYFQNEGVDPVEDVTINWRIDVPVGSIELVQASHPCALSVLNSQECTILFNDIFLPGTNQDNPPPPSYESTIGWVDIDVCFVSDRLRQQGLECAFSEIEILFDLQPPVYADNEICHDPTQPPQMTGSRCVQIPGTQEWVGSQTRSKENDSPIETASIYPNPANDIVTFDMDVLFDEVECQIQILNVRGEEVMHLNNLALSNEKGEILVDHLRPGMYFVKIESGQVSKTLSFIKL